MTGLEIALLVLLVLAFAGGFALSKFLWIAVFVLVVLLLAGRL